VSDGITFNNLSEANQYISDKQREGYEAYYIKKNNKYIVYILGKVLNKHTSIRHVEKEEMYYKGDPAEYDFGKSEIRYTDSVNAKGKTHEIGHARLGHGDYNKNTTAKQIAREEIEAQIFAFTKNDKPINYEVAYPALLLMVDEKEDAKRSVFIVKDVLREKGIDLPHEVEEHWIKFLEEKKTKEE
jgi:hypothetical protein